MPHTAGTCLLSSVVLLEEQHKAGSYSLSSVLSLEGQHTAGTCSSSSLVLLEEQHRACWTRTVRVQRPLPGMRQVGGDDDDGKRR